MLVEKLAAEAGTPLLCLSPSAVLSKWAGESEKSVRASAAAAVCCKSRSAITGIATCTEVAVHQLCCTARRLLIPLPPTHLSSTGSIANPAPQIRAVFEAAAAMSPAIIFIDEVDSLAPCRQAMHVALVALQHAADVPPLLLPPRSHQHAHCICA